MKNEQNAGRPEMGAETLQTRSKQNNNNDDWHRSATTNLEIVPFGKYKGEPIERLLADG